MFYVVGPDGAPLPRPARAVARSCAPRWRSSRPQASLAADPPHVRLRDRPVFATLSDRLAATFKNLRGKGRLSEADIDATAREIRIALLEADVALPVVTRVRRRGQGAGARRGGQRRR